MTLLKKLLVATDFSPGAERAAAVAAEWAERFGAELHWVHGAEHLPAGSTPGGLPLLARHVEQARHAAADQLRACADRARDRGLGCEAHVVDGPVYEAVAGLAHEIGADCVIVGSHGHTGLQRLWLGSVAERIVRRAPCRVLVVRGEDSSATPGTIVVGDDLTPFSTPARKDAVELARAFGARLEVVHSVDLGIPYLSSVEVAIPDALLEQVYAEATERLAGDAGTTGDVAIENTVVSERPVRALCEHAERTRAGLVVVGSHAREGLDRLLLGSVAEGVARRAPCSVLVSRPS